MPEVEFLMERGEGPGRDPEVRRSPDFDESSIDKRLGGAGVREKGAGEHTTTQQRTRRKQTGVRVEGKQATKEKGQ